MNDESAASTKRYFLGGECGGTKSIACLADQDGNEVQRVAGGSANLKLLSDAQLVRHFRSMGDGLLPPAGIAIGMAGAGTKSGFGRIPRAAGQGWTRGPCSAPGYPENHAAPAEKPVRGSRAPAPPPAGQSPPSTAPTPIP